MVQDIQREFDGSQASISRVILCYLVLPTVLCFFITQAGLIGFTFPRWIGILACLLLLALILFTWLPLAYPSGKYHRKFFLALLGANLLLGVKTALGLEFSIPVIRYLLPPLQIPHLSLCWALDLLFEESLPYYAGYAVSLLLFSGLLVLYGFGVHQHPDQP